MLEPSTIKIEGLSDLVKVVEESSETFSTDQLWCRGRIDADWKLQPSVYREPQSIDGYESILAQDFRGSALVHRVEPAHRTGLGRGVLASFS